MTHYFSAASITR